MSIGFDGFSCNGSGVTPSANRPVFEFVVKAAATNSDVVGPLDELDEGLKYFEELVFAVKARAPCVSSTIICNEEKILGAVETLDGVWSPDIDMHHLSWLLRAALGWVPRNLDQCPCNSTLLGILP